MAKSRVLLIVIAHILLGVIIALNTDLSLYFGIFLIGAAVIHIVSTRNMNNQAAKWAGYIVGIEVLLRMTGGFVVWEAGKYTVILILVTGLISEQYPKPYPIGILAYGLLLLPSLVVVDFPDFLHFRTDVSFNLSGPLTLIIASFYFYKKPLNSESFFEVIRVIIWPLLSVAVYITLITPDLSDINYGTQSNFQASGGFGPNQISSMMGLGIFLSGLCLYYRKTITGFLISDIILLLLFLVRGLVTFSRGGMIGGVVALAMLIVLNIFFGRRIWSATKTLIYSLIGLIIFFLTWNYVNDVSENRLQYRYQGYNYKTGNQRDITSGRLLILYNELEMFEQNPFFGIGPGMVREIGLRDGKFANTHSEYSRTLAEHGAFGVFALLILLFSPIKNILRQPQEMYPILFPILFIVFFTMFHSAMRLAMPGFLYGLVFISALSKKLPLHKRSQ
jgi:O-antigen ligase